MKIPQPTPRRSTKERNPPKRYIDFVLSILFIDDGEPFCFEDSIDCVENPKWKMEIKEKMGYLEKKQDVGIG